MSTCTFGPFRLDLSAGQLRRGDAVVPLAPKAFTVLQHLVTRSGQLVTKDELLELAWADVHVGDGALKVCIREIRRALRDDPKTPEYIETAHRRGYRFIAPVAIDTAAAAGPRAHGRARGPGVGGDVRPRDALRAQRRRQHRLSGHRQRSARSRLHHGLGLAPRVLLGRAVVRALPPPARDVLAPHPDRQARHRPLRSRHRAPDARAAHGRRAGGDGSGGIAATRRSSACRKAVRCARSSPRPIPRRRARS